jgi:ornithine cyclodeaminase
VNPLPYLDAAQLRAAVSPTAAVAALRQALTGGSFDPESAGARVLAPLARGEFLLMPAEAAGFTGVKILSHAPGNAGSGFARLQGLFVLFGAEHLEPLALMDAIELTLIRTPAVTTLAVSGLLAATPGRDPAAPLRIAVYGTGPEADRHARTLTANLPVAEIAVVGRRAEAVADLVTRLAADGVPARPGTRADFPAADVIVLVTGSWEPVIADAEVSDQAVVAAIGAHGLGRREVPPELVLRSEVAVETVASALAEAGDLIPARSAEEWQERGLVTLTDLCEGRFTRTPGKPALYNGVGIGWEDLVIAAQAYRVLRDPA